MRSDAGFSADLQYRYWLLRVWDVSLPVYASIGVNPSTADESENDPTVRKDIGFGERLGFGGLLKLNVGAYRATDPRNWRNAIDPIGAENTGYHLNGWALKFGAKLIVAAWGKNGNYAKAQCAKIRDIIPTLMCFGTNPDGTPRHTLMLPYSSRLAAYHDHAEGQNECVTCDKWARAENKTPSLQEQTK